MSVRRRISVPAQLARQLFDEADRLDKVETTQAALSAAATRNAARNMLAKYGLDPDVPAAEYVELTAEEDAARAAGETRLRTATR
ncbi:MAG: hypothetical protein NUW01_13760 [Gemmatimonadaceae bacterium]|nr:hypothetical protein [Gemmatimonadaceae bacterium]